MKKYIIILCIFLLIGLGTFAYFYTRNNTNTESITTVKVNEVTRSVFYAPQYVAISKGFFEQEGLKIELTTGQGADTVMTSVLANQCDIGFAGPEASIYVYNEGKEDNTQVFAQLTKRDGSFLVSKTPAEQFNWKDLIGKTVIPGRRGGVPYMTLEYVIKKNGMNPQTDMVLDDSIKFDLMAGAFTGGEADYVTLFEPTASLIEQSGKGFIVASVGEASGNIPYTAYFAKKSYIKNNSQVIQKFVNAISKAQEWVANATDKEVAEAIVEFFPDTDAELLEKVVGRYRSIDAWKQTPELHQEDFDLLQTVMMEAGELETKVPYEEIVNMEYVK